MKRLTLVGSAPNCQRAMLHASYSQDNAPPAQRQYVMFIQPEYRFEQENELIVFCSYVSLSETEIGRVRKMVTEYGCEYIAVLTKDVAQEAYHAWCTVLLEEFPNLKFLDPECGGPHLDKIKSETGYA